MIEYPIITYLFEFLILEKNANECLFMFKITVTGCHFVRCMFMSPENVLQSITLTVYFMYCIL